MSSNRYMFFWFYYWIFDIVNTYNISYSLCMNRVTQKNFVIIRLSGEIVYGVFEWYYITLRILKFEVYYKTLSVKFSMYVIYRSFIEGHKIIFRFKVRNNWVLIYELSFNRFWTYRLHLDELMRGLCYPFLVYIVKNRGYWDDMHLDGKGRFQLCNNTFIPVIIGKT